MTQVNCARIDCLKFVQGRQSLSGSVPVAGYGRLVESLHDPSGQLDYQLKGDVDQQNRPLLKLSVRGVVQLECQRCMAALAHQIGIQTALRLVAAEALDSEYDDDPDEPDCVAASAAFDWMELIEDEVLLSLPAYPRHESGHCTKRGDASDAMQDGGAAAGEKNSAFSVLQALKLKVNQSKE